MKQIMGAILFIVGLGVYIKQAIIHSNDSIPTWITIIIFVLIGFGLDMVMTGLINDAKKELREEIEELRDELRGR